MHDPTRAGQRFLLEQGSDLLSPEETYHLIRVLRKRPEEEILLIDGKGKEYLGRIHSLVKVGKHLQAKVEILKLLREEGAPAIRITALIPLLKGEDTEFLVEKGTELGITVFSPYQSKHTVRSPKPNLLLRLRAKAISALKQSGRLILPEVKEVNPLNKLLQGIPRTAFKLCAHPSGEATLNQIIGTCEDKVSEVYLLTGPEGDFSPEELKLIKESEFLLFKLSPYILRANTASFLLMGLIQVLIKDL